MSISVGLGKVERSISRCSKQLPTDVEEENMGIGLVDIHNIFNMIYSKFPSTIAKSHVY